MPQINELLGKVLCPRPLVRLQTDFCLTLFHVAAALYIKYEYDDKLRVYIFQSLNAFFFD